MDLQSLTLLVEIIDSGNLSQAARKLRMTRANVSYHLTQLEQSVGAQLLRRSTRHVEPTEIGLRLYEHGRAIQNEMLAARETVTRLGQGLQGRGVEGIELVRALDGHGADGAVVGDSDQGIGHGETPGTLKKSDIELCKRRRVIACIVSSGYTLRPLS